MKRFKFSLQAVQTVRERAARTALETYARALRGRLEAEAALQKADTLLSNHLAEWRESMKKAFSPSERLQQEHLRQMLEAHRNECAKNLREASQLALQAHSNFHLARQKSEVVERFHDRQRRDFNLGVLKEEQNLCDELASARHQPGLFEKDLAHA